MNVTAASAQLPNQTTYNGKRFVKEETIMATSLAFLSNLWAFFVNLFMWLGFLVTVGPIFLVLFIWRIVVICFVKLFHKRLDVTIPNDTYFAIECTKKMPIVNAVQIWRIQGLVEIEEFRQHFYRCFLETPDCRRRYRNLFMYLVRFSGYVFKRSVENIQLEKHIREVIIGEDVSLNTFISKFMFEDEYREKAPLWEILLVRLPLTCIREEHETVLLFKIHHCLADGYSFIHIVDKLTGNESPYLVQPYDDNFFDKIKVAFKMPKTLMDYWVDVAHTKDLFYPIKNPNAAWFIGFASVDLEILKQLRRQTKTHFASLMMSLMIGALRRLLLESQTEADLPKYIWTANSLPWPNHPRNTLINHWSGGQFRVPLQCSDPLERVYGADEFFNLFHSSWEMHKMVKRIIINFTWCIPTFLMRLGHSADLSYFRYSNAFATLMLSNEKHFLLGKHVRNINLPLALKDVVPTSVLFGVSTSHSGQVDLSVTANSDIVHDQEAINRLTTRYFHEELQELIFRCNLANVQNSQPSNIMPNSK